MAFPPGFLDELRARISLSDVVGRKVSLKRRSGSEYAGLCPFHNEKTPSFTVNDKKGFFHCFGCGEHGDAVGFVMKSEGLSFPESVEKLAREAGLPVPHATPAERERVERVATLQEVVEAATRWFEKQLRLPVGRGGMDYLRGRGLDEATIEAFRLGFAPDTRDGLLAALKREGVPVDKIVEAGLAIQPDDGREAYDRFRGRVIFPINDRRGRVIAFGGRVMGPGEPKYLNSPETPLFHKGANLYCLDRARVAATKDHPILVAEGYMDVIALHGAGFTGSVAPLGTALTEHQLSELWKLSDEPYLCFDGDNAGRRAAYRAAERALPLLRPGKSLLFLTLLSGDDPDSLIRRQGANAVRNLLDQARPLVDIVWDMDTEGKPADTPERRASIEQSVQRRVAGIADPVVREYYRTEMRNRLYQARRPQQTAWRKDWKAGGRPWRGSASPADVAPFAAGTGAQRTSSALDSSRQERALLGALIERPALLHSLSEEFAHLPIVHPELRRLQKALLDVLALVPLGIDPAVQSGLPDDQPLEAQLIEQHLSHVGLQQVAQEARSKAREVFQGSPGDPEAWIGQWRRTAGHITRLMSDREELELLAAACAEDMNDENLRRLHAVIDRIQRDHIEAAAGG